MSTKRTKTEKYFAEKLNSRTLEPTEKAWKKIQQQIQPPKKSKNKFLWFVPVAAALAVLGLVYIQQTNEDYKPTKTNEKPIQQVVIKDDSLWQSKPILDKKTSKTSVAEVHRIRKELKNIDKNTELKPTEITENQLVETAQLPELSTENSLAENTTTINKKAFPKLKIDSKNLLNETETEVTKGFREKVIEKIATNYELVKEAYANRNYEKSND